MVHTFFQFLADQGFITLFFVLGLGNLIGRLKIGFFSLGSTAGSMLVALLVGILAFELAGVKFAIPDLLTTFFLALFTYAIGLRVGPQFVDGMRREGLQLSILVMVSCTVAFIMAFGGSKLLSLAPGYAPGILAGSNTVSAVLGVATAAVDQGLYQPSGGVTAEQVKANIAAGYSLSYLLSMLGIVMLVRNLPGMFGHDPVQAAKKAEQEFGTHGHALPGTAGAFEHGMQPVDVRVYRLDNADFIGQPATAVGQHLGTPVLRVTRDNAALALDATTTLRKGDLLTVGGRIGQLLHDPAGLGPEVDDNAARTFEVEQAEIILSGKNVTGKTLQQLLQDPSLYGVRVRAVFRAGHELPAKLDMPLRRHDLIRVIGPAAAVKRAAALGHAVRPTNVTDVITLAFGIASGYLVGLATVKIAGIPVGLGAMGGVVVAGMLVSIMRSMNPSMGGPMPEGARALLESIGVDLFVCGLGLNVAPALIDAVSHGWDTAFVLLLGLGVAIVPTFVTYVVGLYVLRMDPIILAGAVAGARNSTTAMRAISDRAHSDIPSYGYPVTYALSTVVLLVYGYLAMVMS
ncbi:aspartate:alanine exchanger family transporter [Lysobacter cavernae]|uniref:Aspartate:alanine exchanger family transporter n=1 Tax=Lysobacter cavernae TaxID=1685901 RepID=A0ABV7RPX0_9GAMM